jgi:hypothetical protein
MYLEQIEAPGPNIESYTEAAFRLHNYLAGAHWNGRGLTGPDAGVRFNARIWRFFKSYAPRYPWKDSYYYLQTQGYWVLANWRLFQQTGESVYRETAIRCSEHMIERQRKDGAWDYPNPEWGGRVATAEGTWGSLGLLETYRHTGDRTFLASALRWHRFLLDEIGFEEMDDELAVNYFSNKPTARIPNNSAFVLRFLAELADLTGHSAYRDPCPGMITFLSRAQKTSGEFPYMVRGKAAGVKYWEHYLCYQYNAFQSMDLTRYYELTGDSSVRRLVSACLQFLRGGVASDGHSLYDCHNRHQEIVYHTAALGGAFASAHRLGIGKHDDMADRCFQYLLTLRRTDGSFPFSRGDYYVLSDGRSYPRVLVMILFHLLVRIQTETALSDSSI